MRQLQHFGIPCFCLNIFVATKHWNLYGDMIEVSGIVFEQRYSVATSHVSFVMPRICSPVVFNVVYHQPYLIRVMITPCNLCFGYSHGGRINRSSLSESGLPQ